MNKDWDSSFIPVGIVGIGGAVEEGYAFGPIAESQTEVYVSYANRYKKLFDLVSTKRITTSRRQFTNISGVPQRGAIDEVANISVEGFFRMSIGKEFTKEEVRAALGMDKPKDLDKLIKNGILEARCIRRCLITGELNKSYGLAVRTMEIEELDTLMALREYYASCVGCQLGVDRMERGVEKTVLGRGTGDGRAIIIGEAPGRQEEATGIAFYPSAPAGNVLARVMAKVGLDQEEWYISNSVCCRPLPNKPGSENGKPTIEHIQACLPRLKALLHLIRPKLVVLLGRYAYISYYGKAPTSIGSVLGWDATTTPRVYLTYHPAYIVRKAQDKSVVMNYLEQWKEIAEFYRSI